MKRPRKTGIAWLGDGLSNVAAGKLHSHEYSRQSFPFWNAGPGDFILIHNMRIVDVNEGKIRDERGVLIKDGRIERLVAPGDAADQDDNRPVHTTIDCGDLYVIPGLSDIHAHLSLVSEFDLSLGSLRYFDAQRQRNCEEALKAGCTFVRDSGGAYEVCSFLQREIEAARLLGPRILPTYEVLTPKGGMWDLGPVPNYLGRMLFGGRILNFVRSSADITRALERLSKLGAQSFKTYFEERPLYGAKESTRYNMFTVEQARLFRRLANRYERLLEAHSMFSAGSRIAAEAGFDSIAHMTVDKSYDGQLAGIMRQNGVAIVPTLSLGCYLAMNCGSRGFPDHADNRFFQEMRCRYAPQQIARTAVPELRSNYQHFQEWLDEELPDRKMPGVGQVYPERVHGFARYAAESIRSFREAGVRIGIGTDGGTGITFAGQLEVEFEALHHFGFTLAEILRMATLGNMEIVRHEDELGSIEPGKYADLVVLGRNPLDDVQAIQDVRKVFKGGRLVFNDHTSDGSELGVESNALH